MKYDHIDKKTGLSLSKNVYAEHFADVGDIKTNYMVQLYGDTILEGEDPVKMADQIMKITDRLYMIADFLRRKNAHRGTIDEPNGDH